VKIIKRVNVNFSSYSDTALIRMYDFQDNAQSVIDATVDGQFIFNKSVSGYELHFDYI